VGARTPAAAPPPAEPPPAPEELPPSDPPVEGAVEGTIGRLTAGTLSPDALLAMTVHVMAWLTSLLVSVYWLLD
jgi:hypothetical protein